MWLYLLVLATQFWFIDLPWWAFWPLVVLGVVLFLLGARYLWEEWSIARSMREAEKERHEQMASEVIYPYYAEVDGLRNLAHSVKLDLPTAKQVTRSKRFSFGTKGTVGESGRSETQEYDGQLPLLELAAKVETVGYHNNGGHPPATGVATAVPISDERSLSSVIEQIQRDFGATSETAELLTRVKDGFGQERIKALVEKKRQEFESVAKDNRMLVFQGQFVLKGAGKDGCGPTLSLSHFNPSPGFMSLTGDEEDQRPDFIPIAEGVGFDLVLPDADALTPAGSERILRPEPFFVGVIAHSPSFNQATGILTCSAWAVWGQKTANWYEEPSYRYRVMGGY